MPRIFSGLGNINLVLKKLKTIAISAPMLAHPSPDGLFILDCDASGTQISAELSQVQNGVIKPICYASHVLIKQHQSK